MKSIGIFYGSTTGTTAHVAEMIAQRLSVSADNLHDVTQTAPSEVGAYDLLIFGASTWGDGELQQDMHDFLDGVASLDLNNKYVALFGCGDETMSNTFCNGVGRMYEMLKGTGANFVGRFNAEGYHYDHSEAQADDTTTVGLVLDNVNRELLTADKIQKWTDELLRQIGR